MDSKSVDPVFKSTGFVASRPWFNSSVALIHSQLICLLPVGILYLLSLLELFLLKGSGQWNNIMHFHSCLEKEERWSINFVALEVVGYLVERKLPGLRHLMKSLIRYCKVNHCTLLTRWVVIAHLLDGVILLPRSQCCYWALFVRLIFPIVSLLPNMKAFWRSILDLVVKWRHQANDVLSQGYV